jgi:hypothetical protein
MYSSSRFLSTCHTPRPPIFTAGDPSWGRRETARRASASVCVLGTKDAGVDADPNAAETHQSSDPRERLPRSRRAISSSIGPTPSLDASSSASASASEAMKPPVTSARTARIRCWLHVSSSLSSSSGVLRAPRFSGCSIFRSVWKVSQGLGELGCQMSDPIGLPSPGAGSDLNKPFLG